MRISRGNEVIGNRSVIQIKKGIADASLLATDSFYHEDSSEWLPLSEFLAMQAPAPRAKKPAAPPCYCGSGLSFQACHGDGSHY